MQSLAIFLLLLVFPFAASATTGGGGSYKSGLNSGTSQCNVQAGYEVGDCFDGDTLHGFWNESFAENFTNFTLDTVDEELDTEPAEAGFLARLHTLSNNDQYSRFCVKNLANNASNTLAFGFTLRSNSVGFGDAYGVAFQFTEAGDEQIIWFGILAGNSTLIEASILPTGTITSGKCYGAKVTGTGSDTEVEAWIWDTEPGAYSQASWGTPTATFTDDPVPGLSQIDAGQIATIFFTSDNTNHTLDIDDYGIGSTPPAGNAVLWAQDSVSTSTTEGSNAPNRTLQVCNNGTGASTLSGATVSASALACGAAQFTPSFSPSTVPDMDLGECEDVTVSFSGTDACSPGALTLTDAITVTASGITGSPATADINLTVLDSGGSDVLNLVVDNTRDTGCQAGVEACGPGPIGVFFNLDNSTHTNSDVDTTRDIYYTADFGDPGSGFHPYGANPERNKDANHAPMFAHVYEPSSYPDTCTSTLGYGTISCKKYTATFTGLAGDGATDTATVDIEVTDPDGEYPDSNTVCMAPDGEATGCPLPCTTEAICVEGAAATGTVLDGFAAQANTRVLVERGSTIAHNDRIYLGTDSQLGAFGSGAIPNIDCDGDCGYTSGFGSYFLNMGTRSTLFDIFHTGETPTTTFDGIRGLLTANCKDDVLILRVTGRQGSYGFVQSEGLCNTKISPTNPDPATGLIIADSDWAGNATSIETYSWYGSAAKSAFLGNRIHRGDPTCEPEGNCGGHNVRFPSSHRVLFKNNRLDGGIVQAQLRVHNDEDQVVLNRFAVLDSQFLEYEAKAEFSSQSNVGGPYVAGQYIWFENNFITNETMEAVAATQYQNFSFINNVVIHCNPFRFWIRNSLPWSYTDAGKASGARIYQNTFYCPSGNLIAAHAAPSSTTASQIDDVFMRGNLLYAPTGTAVMHNLVDPNSVDDEQDNPAFCPTCQYTGSPFAASAPVAFDDFFCTDPNCIDSGYDWSDPNEVDEFIGGAFSGCRPASGQSDAGARDNEADGSVFCNAPTSPQLNCDATETANTTVGTEAPQGTIRCNNPGTAGVTGLALTSPSAGCGNAEFFTANTSGGTTIAAGGFTDFTVTYTDSETCDAGGPYGFSIDATADSGLSDTISGSLTVNVVIASGTEQACTDLINDGNGGTTCICSETLNWNGGDPFTPASGPPNLFDPANSSPPTECYSNQSGTTIRTLDGANLSMVQASTRPGLGLPSGQYIFRRNSGSGQFAHNHTNFTNATYCSRVYVREGDDTPTAEPDPANVGAKGITFEGTAANEPNTDFFWVGTGTTEATNVPIVNHLSHNVAGRVNWPSRIASRLPGSDDIRINDVSDLGWARIEICLDHNPYGGNRMYYRAKMVALANGKEINWNIQSTNTVTSAVTATKKTHIPRFRSNYSADRWVAYIMTAKKSPADQNFWIGPAIEINE